MGRPPDAHSTLAPAGTTGVPGLIPDLVARTPWPHWALAIVTLAAAVLIASCLLCAICRPRRRKEPRDKEAVGLGPTRCSRMWMTWGPVPGSPSSGGTYSCLWSTTVEARRSGCA
ncbi:synaptotagmin-8-like [Lemur catta]|uniref:synaptotagmin-8-like n=1 Tax=Lemur catta TaxID=9447 RepID=UPI001E26D8A9|nr:synaptotagmin-8-like [Lemur catta]